MIQSTLVNLHPNELAQSLLYYPFAVDLDRCMGSCNTLNNLSNRLCVPEKTEDLDMNVFNMITGINVKITITKKLTKHISCKWGCNLIVKKWNNGIKKSNQKWNTETWQCEWKNYQVCKEDYSRNPSTCICENGKYLKSVTDDLKLFVMRL